MKNLLKISSLFALIAGLLLIAGGIWGIIFTYKNVEREKIVTPADAAIPNAQVKGPFTLKAQADVIRKHMLNMTGGKTYAEMPRQIAKVDDKGAAVLDTNGQPVMVPNTLRDTWVTATALTTALNFAIITYVFAGLLAVLGLISIWTGYIFHKLKNNFR